MAGTLLIMMLILVQERMAHAALRWTFGRLTTWQTLSPPTTVPLPVTTDVKEQNVVTTIVMSVMMVFVIKMVVTGQSTDLVIKNSMDQDQNIHLIQPFLSPSLPSSSLVMVLTVETL